MPASLIHPQKPVPTRRWTLRVLALAGLAALLLTVVFVNRADAHGTAISPMSRQYSCWQRWGSDFQDPAMQTDDPMCWQAWQANPNAMWNWNGLYQNGLAGNYQGSIPDGELCSGGHAGGGIYNALDTTGDWTATPLSTDFTFVNVDEAEHGAVYYRIYISKNSYDPTTQPLGWDDLDLVTETGSYAPGEGDPAPAPLTGVTVSFPVDASSYGYTGRHVVFMIWEAAHMDQAFFACSDVTFG